MQLARRPLPFEWFWIAPIGIDPLSLTALGAAALGLVTWLVAARRLGFAVAARIAVLLVPGAAVRVLLGPAGQRHLLVDAVRPAWAAVAAGVAALVSFGLALIVLTVVERVVRLVLLGRMVEAERASGGAAEPLPDGRPAGSGRDGRS
ncbi:hypothetical protein AB0I55_02435 [Actinocatenispora sera]|uniref:hypothetical protein n=1 Tax=Actinocatenispora sera TaxID=390989 RepID=UPI0033FA6508